MNNNDLMKDIAELNLKRQTRIVPIESAEEGMLVAHDILNLSGKCLITAGTVLTSFIIKSLIHQGITHISVQSIEHEGEPISEDEIQAAQEEGIKKMKNRFKEIPSDSMMKIIYDTALKIEILDCLKCKKNQ